jgi:Protein of unknown function (DUF3048) N-terminal domain/Protein of unknown function (DUF3048) C-terminal domain
MLIAMHLRRTLPPRRRPTASRSLRTVAAGVLATSLFLAGCSSDGESPTAEKEGQEDGGEAAPPPPPVSPLTGIELGKRAADKPVIGVKVDNTSSSAPQVGLGSADMLVEELVEGGMTRLAAFFHTEVPSNVGPVRSLRATDIGVVQPLNAVLVASGGAPQTVERVRDAGIRTFTEGATGYYRDTGRAAPYNLFMRLDELARTVKDRRLPNPYLPFSEEGDLPKGKPARTLTAIFSGSSTTTFEYRKGVYVNTDSYAGEGDRFEPATVLVLRVPVGDAGYLDPSGATVPETKFTGQGPAVVFNGGRAVRGTWVKNGLDAPVRLKAGGATLRLPAGKVWIELVPAHAGGVTFGR